MCVCVGGTKGAILQGSKLASPREVLKTEQKLADFRLSWELVSLYG